MSSDSQLIESSSKPQPRGLLRSSAIVSSFTMISRFLGLARDIIFAKFIGAGGDMDAFIVAFKIPNFLRRLFAEGAFAQAFVPVLSEYRAAGNMAVVRHFIDRIAGCLGITLLAVSVIVVIASPVFAAIFGMGFYLNDPQKFALTSELLRITFPYLLLISMTGFAGAILNSYDHFAAPALTPVLLNVVLILSAVIVAPMLDIPVFALAWGVFVAGVIQFLFQLPFLLRLGLLPHPTIDWSDAAVIKVLKLMGPAIFGVSVSQINLLFDTMLASFLPDGSVAWLYFSDRLTELPLGVFAIGIATVILPSLSRQVSQEQNQFSRTLDWAIRTVLIIAIPSAVALVIIAEPVLYTLFQYDKTTSHDVLMSSYSLRAYAIGLTAFMLIKVLVSGYFSRQDTRTPVKIGIIAMVSNMFLNVVFVLPLHFIWQVGHMGLALATSVSACLNAALLYRGLRREKVYLPASGKWSFVLKILIANIAMATVLLAINAYFPSFAGQSWWWRCWVLSLLFVAGLISYVLSLFALGMRPQDFKAPVT